MPSNKYKLKFLSLDTKSIKLKKAKKTPFEQISRHLATQALAVAAVIGSVIPAQAATFKFTYQSGVTQQQIEAVELAGNIWSSYLQDTNLNINIHFGMTTGQLAAGKLGGATPAIQKINYDKFKQGLQADGTANINLLPTSKYSSNLYSARLQGGIATGLFYELLTTTANNKALGNDLSGTASGLDAYIQLEQSVNWNYNYAGGTIGSNQYDFVSVVLHELGHSLGFISGVDALSGLALPTALDMFRYSTQSANQKAIDYSVGGTKYFSTNGGLNPFSVTETITTATTTTTIQQQALFSTGENTFFGGDGDQASHWKYNTNPYLGIMSSTINSGEIRKISKLDLTALDYIGWQVNHSATLNLPALFANAKTKATTATIVDRSSDVEEMMDESGIYNWRWNGYWQTANSTQSEQIPEPTSTMGILGLALLGICSVFQAQVKNKCDRIFKLAK